MAHVGESASVPVRERDETLVGEGASVPVRERGETLAQKIAELAEAKGVTTREALSYIMRRLWGTDPFWVQREKLREAGEAVAELYRQAAERTDIGTLYSDAAEQVGLGKAYKRAWGKEVRDK